MALIRSIADDVVRYSDEKGNHIFSMTETASATEYTIYLSGEIITEAALEFEDEIIAALSFGKEIVLDFADIRYICSQGMTALLTVQQLSDETVQVDISIRNMRPDVMKCFADTGFLDLLDIQ